METEGEAEFVRQESQRLYALIGQAPQTPGMAARTPAQETLPALWNEVAEVQKGGLTLRSKPSAGNIEEACLLLLASARHLLDTEKPTATQLARWLRQSGCPFDRLDRVLNDAVKRGEILAAGHRRSRRYELTHSGLSKAALAAHRLAQKIAG